MLASLLFPNGASEWENPVMAWLTSRYRHAVKWAIEHRFVTVGLAGLVLLFAGFLGFSGIIGSEFLPHLDEGAIWVRGTLAPSTGPTESLRIMNEARLKLSAFPEVTKVVSQTGRPDDGTDTTGFFNTEYFVDLKPKDEWRPVFKQNKDELIAAMDRELEKTPGVIWNFSQPISDNVEEAVSGVKGELAVKIYGDDLKTLEEKGDEIVSIMSKIRGVQDLGLFRVIGQPNLNYIVNREAAARYGINVADVQDAIQTAVGGNAVTQVLQGEAATTSSSATSRSIATPRKPSTTFACSPPAASASRSPSSPPSRPKMAPKRSIARAASATSPSSTASAIAISAAPSKRRFRRLTNR